MGTVRSWTLSSSGPDTVALLGDVEEGLEGESEGSDGGKGCSSCRFDREWEPVTIKIYGEGTVSMIDATSESQHGMGDLRDGSPFLSSISTLRTFLPSSIFSISV